MNQNRNRDQDSPNRESNMEPAEGSRSGERGQGAEGERNRTDEGSRGNSGGITNRPLDRERCEQANVPERGQSQAER